MNNIKPKIGKQYRVEATRGNFQTQILTMEYLGKQHIPLWKKRTRVIDQWFIILEYPYLIYDDGFINIDILGEA